MVQRLTKNGTFENVYPPQTATPDKAAYVDLAPGEIITVIVGAGVIGAGVQIDVATGAVIRTVPTPTGSTVVGPFAAMQRFIFSSTVGNVDIAVSAASFSTPQLAYDPAGNVNGLGLGGVYASLRQISGNLRVGVGGDSISEVWTYLVGNGTTIVSPGVARMTFASAFGSGSYWPGDTIKVTGATVLEANTMNGVVTAIDTATRLWIEYTIPPGTGNSVLGTAPTMYHKSRMITSAYLAQAFAQAGIAWTLTVDAALGGGDSSQVNEILQRDWAACDLAVYGPGMNDVYSRSWTADRIIANDTANLKIMRQATKLVILTIPPRNALDGAWSTTRFAVWRKVNEWRRRYAATIGADLVDVASAELNGRTYADPASTTATPPSSGILQTSSDGVHPVGLGGVVMGAGLSSVMGSIPRLQYLPTSASVNAVDGYTVLNGLMTGAVNGTTSGTATFTNLSGLGAAEVPNGFVANVVTGNASLAVKVGLVQRTKAVHGDSLGKSMRMIIDNSAGVAGVVVGAETLSFHAQMVDGDDIDFGGHVLVSSATTPGTGDPDGLTSIAVGLLDQHSVALNKFAYAFSGDAGTGYFPGFSLAPIRRERTRRVTSAGAFSKTNVQFTFYVAAGKTACVDIGRVLARRVV